MSLPRTITTSSYRSATSLLSQTFLKCWDRTNILKPLCHLLGPWASTGLPGGPLQSNPCRTSPAGDHLVSVWLQRFGTGYMPDWWMNGGICGVATWNRALRRRRQGTFNRTKHAQTSSQILWVNQSWHVKHSISAPTRAACNLIDLPQTSQS
jgi:hypothetical protein